MPALTVDLATPVTTLALIGGGEFSFGETREIDTFLIQRMPADRRNIAFLPTASGSAEYAVHLGKYFQQIDPTLQTINVPVYRGRDSRRQKNADLLLGAGMIYIGGGVSTPLLETLQDSPVEAAMRAAAAHGVVVAAIGAAAAALGVHARDQRGATGAVPALGWLDGTVVETGFEPENDTGLRRLMSLPDVRLGIGIPAKTALVISAGGSTQVLGEGAIAAFRKT